MVVQSLTDWSELVLTAIEKVDILVSKILTQLQPFLKYRAGNSDKARANIIELNKNLPKHYLITSLDIVNMYPNVPINPEALNVVKKYLAKHQKDINMYGFGINHVMAMLEFVFQNTYISYSGEYYIQLES